MSRNERMAAGTKNLLSRDLRFKSLKGPEGTSKFKKAIAFAKHEHNDIFISKLIAKEEMKRTYLLTRFNTPFFPHYHNPAMV